VTGLLRNVGRVAGRGWGWIRDYAYVAYWQVHGFLFPADPLPYLEASGRPDAPVLILPGVYETWQFLKPLADSLHRDGHPVHVVRTLGYNRGTVEKMAELAADYLDTAGLSNVTLVAHSKGGLIGKRLMTRPESAGRIRHMVAINTPFSGSHYARFFLAPSIRAFAPGNAALLALAREQGAHTRITSVYSEFDPHIPGGSHLSDAENITLATSGHFRIIADPRVLRIIRDRLPRKGA
jgi:triacylglycerol lipase